MEFLNTPETRDRRMIHLPMGRFGEAIEIAKAALFRMSASPLLYFRANGPGLVASDDSSYVTVRDILSRLQMIPP